MVVDVSSHFTCPEFTPGLPHDDARLTFGELPHYPKFTPGLEVSKMLFFLTQGNLTFAGYLWFQKPGINVFRTNHTVLKHVLKDSAH